MKKGLIAAFALIIGFASVASAAETFTEKYIQKKIQPVVNKEKQLTQKHNDAQAKAKAQKDAIKNKQASEKAKIEAKKKAQQQAVAKKKADIKSKQTQQKNKVDTKKKQLNDLLKF